MKISAEEAKCKHDGLFLLSWYGPSWVCSRGCGFSLNFDPNIFPEGVAYVDKPPYKEKVLPPLHHSLK